MRPAEKKIRFELNRLFYGELASIVAFWICYFTLTRKYEGPVMWDVIYLLCVASFILLQGAMFWWILRKRRKNKNFAKPQTEKIYLALKYVNLILLLIAFPLMRKFSTPMGINRFSVLLWIFILIEWVNYFAYRLSYPGNPLELIQRLSTRTLKKSRLSREIKAWRKGR